jgi:hypothetical protein
MSKSSIRRKLQALREQLCPQQPVIIGVSVDTRSGAIRNILTDDGINKLVPAKLSIEDLPATCRVFRYDPSRECLSMYQSTHDGLAHAQRVLGVNEDILLGRAPSWDAPMSEWETLFAGQNDGGDCRASD